MSSPTPPEHPTPQSASADSNERGWLERNLKWVLPVGCLSIVVAIVAFAGGIVLIVMAGMRSTWAYETALERVREHPAAIEALGEPIEAGRFTSGSVSVDGSSGEADLSIPLRGSRAKGRLYVTAERVRGEWRLLALELVVDGERIDLLAAIEGSRSRSAPSSVPRSLASACSA